MIKEILQAIDKVVEHRYSFFTLVLLIVITYIITYYQTKNGCPKKDSFVIYGVEYDQTSNNSMSAANKKIAVAKLVNGLAKKGKMYTPDQLNTLNDSMLVDLLYALNSPEGPDELNDLIKKIDILTTPEFIATFKSFDKKKRSYPSTSMRQSAKQFAQMINKRANIAKLNDDQVHTILVRAKQ
jgi:hypothetical protein